MKISKRYSQFALLTCRITIGIVFLGTFIFFYFILNNNDLQDKILSLPLGIILLDLFTLSVFIITSASYYKKYIKNTRNSNVLDKRQNDNFPEFLRKVNRITKFYCSLPGKFYFINLPLIFISLYLTFSKIEKNNDKEGNRYTVELLIPNYMQSAEVIVDGKKAKIIGRNEKSIKILIIGKNSLHKIRLFNDFSYCENNYYIDKDMSIPICN